MKSENDLQTSVHPSKQKLAKATTVAFAVAIIILFVAILPAEYGIDPLGTGAALGLTSLSKAAAAGPDAPVTPVTIAPVVTGVYTGQPKTYKVDSEDINLAPGMGVEIKYHMEKGAGMIYSWKATGPVMFEFHGEPDQKPNEDYYDSYELVDKVGKTESHGSFTAPSTGIHGWFWENKGGKAVNVVLHTAGFYDSIKYFGASGEEELPAEDVQ